MPGSVGDNYSSVNICPGAVVAGVSFTIPASRRQGQRLVRILSCQRYRLTEGTPNTFTCQEFNVNRSIGGNAVAGGGGAPGVRLQANRQDVRWSQATTASDLFSMEFELQPSTIREHTNTGGAA